MIVGKEYIGGNRLFEDFFFTIHSCTDELSRQVVSKSGVTIEIRTFSLSKNIWNTFFHIQVIIIFGESHTCTPSCSERK